MLFLKQLRNVEDSDIFDKEVQLKNGTEKMYSAGKKIQTASITKLHNLFNESHEIPVSLSVFYQYKPFYFLRPSEKDLSIF